MDCSIELIKILLERDLFCLVEIKRSNNVFNITACHEIPWKDPKKDEVKTIMDNLSSLIGLKLEFNYFHQEVGFSYLPKKIDTCLLNHVAFYLDWKIAKMKGHCVWMNHDGLENDLKDLEKKIQFFSSPTQMEPFIDGSTNKHGMSCIPQLMENIHKVWAQIAFHKITQLEMYTNGDVRKAIKMAQNWMLNNLNQEAKNIFKGEKQ